MLSRDVRAGLHQDVQALFDTGTTGGLTDGELLGRLTDRPVRADAAGSAFAALVDRHGSMVFRVCRSILRDEHDAQDAFQATFLVLVRRAGALRRRDSVGSWLHGVALRVAAHARSAIALRRRHERCAGERALTADRSGAERNSPELAAIIHEELGRLPETYREAVVLCYLEGHTCDAAARRLGWPVGTVKSRLARARQRLRTRLRRRGLVPDGASEREEGVRTSGFAGNALGAGPAHVFDSVFGDHITGGLRDVRSDSPPAPALVVPAGLAHTTVDAMLRFAAGRPIAGVVSPAALSWTFRTLGTMHMTRFAMITVLLILVLAATGTGMLATQQREPAQAVPSTPVRTAAQKTEPSKSAVSERNTKLFTVRVVDTMGRNVADVEVKLLEEDARPADDGPGYLTGSYRTGDRGRARIDVDSRFRRLEFKAQPDERTLGWASLQSGRLKPKATDDDPITLTLLPMNHRVEGTIVDTRRKPIGGVRVRVVQFSHGANGFVTDYRVADEEPSLGWAVTDEAGRYRLSLPKDTTAFFRTYHAKFVGPGFSCKPDDNTIAPVTLEDAGGIAGTVTDAVTGQPVAGALIGAQRIEHTHRVLGGNWGSTLSDAQGRFAVGGLAPGVYNLLFQSSPKGRRFTARAIEGVRVNVGEEARADLQMIAGRRVHGTARGGRIDRPLVGTPIFCYSASHPRSGAACQGTYTDEQGRFEHFVPPGPALVYIAEPGQFGLEHRRILGVPNDRDPEPIVLKQGDDPNTKEPPSSRGFVECEVRVRVKTDAGDRPAQKEDRTLSGRVFDQRGSSLIGVQVYDDKGQTLNEGATDRYGVFRLRGLPHGPLRLGLRRNHDQNGWARVPAEAVEIDLIFPE